MRQRASTTTTTPTTTPPTLSPTLGHNHSPSSSSSSPLSLRKWFSGNAGHPLSSSSSRDFPPIMAAPATSARPARSTASSKLSTLASAFGFGSRSSSKPARADPYEPPTHAGEQYYSLDHDPFSPTSSMSAQSSPSPLTLSPTHSAPHVFYPHVSTRPARPDSSGNALPPPRPLPSSPTSTTSADADESSASTGLFHRSKRADSSSSRAKCVANILPVGNRSTAAATEQNRGSWHSRQRSSIDLQLPQLARPSRTSDDFSSMLDAVAHAGFTPSPSPLPSLSSSGRAAAALEAPVASASGSASQRPRTTSARAPPSAALPQPPPAFSITRARSHTASEGIKRRNAAPTSPNTLRRLLPTLPPTQSLPPTPPHAAHQQRPSTATLPHAHHGGRLGVPRDATANRPATATGAGTTSGPEGATSLSLSLSVQTPNPAVHRALSPIMPSPSSSSAKRPPSASARSASPAAARGLSPRVSSSESSSLLFAAVPDSDRSEASSISSNEKHRATTGSAAGKENYIALTRALSDADARYHSPRGSIGSADQHTLSTFAMQSRRTSNSSSFHTHILRKSTSQSHISPTDVRQRTDSSSTSTTVRSTLWSSRGTDANSSATAKLIRKQRSLHSVAIPPVPKQAVPQPPTPGTSPTAPSLLSSWTLKRRSTGRGADQADFVQGGRDDGSTAPGAFKTPREQQQPRRPSVTSSARPSTPQSTFFDDTDSTHRASASFSPDTPGLPKIVRRESDNAQQRSDLIQYIIPPDELATSWGSASRSASVLNVSDPSDAKPGESSSTPSESSTRIPPTVTSKSMPSSPTRGRSREASATSMPPSRAGSFVGKRQEEQLVLTSPVGFGGGLALAPMPPRKPQAASTGRARGGSLLAEANATSGLSPPPRHALRPGPTMSSMRSDSALRNLAMNGSRSAAALDLLSSRRQRPISKASSGSGASSSEAFVSPTSASSTGPPPVARKRSILKKPSFLDMEDADNARSMRAAAAAVRAKPVTVQLVPPPQSSASVSAKPKHARTATRGTIVVVDQEDPTDSFLDLTTRNSFSSVSSSSSSTGSSADDPCADGISVEQDVSPEYLKWGR